MNQVVLACRDLMTSSKMEGSDSLIVQRASNEKRVFELLENATADVVVVVDLTAFFQLLEQLQKSKTPNLAAVIAFAPHVQTDLLERAAKWADIVVPRGVVVRDLKKLVDRALASAYGDKLRTDMDNVGV